MIYFDKDDLPLIFKLVGEHYARQEEIPDYLSERSGIEKLAGIFQGVQQDIFYPDLTRKATYLLVQINKGHFFSNGNKRLALAIAVGFLAVNERQLIFNQDKDEYRKFVSELFPLYKTWEDHADFSPEEFALYNLSIIVADSEKYIDVSSDHFDALKERVIAFFERNLTDYTELRG